MPVEHASGGLTFAVQASRAQAPTRKPTALTHGAQHDSWVERAFTATKPGSRVQFLGYTVWLGRE